jgi:hypothetical protein
MPDGWVALAACLGAACAVLLLLLLRRWGMLGGKFKFDDGTLPEGSHPRAQALAPQRSWADRR